MTSASAAHQRILLRQCRGIPVSDTAVALVLVSCGETYTVSMGGVLRGVLGPKAERCRWSKLVLELAAG